MFKGFWETFKVEIILEQRELRFYHPAKFAKILLGDKNATYLCSKIISNLQSYNRKKLEVLEV